MKKQQIFPAAIFVGFGLYLLLQQKDVPFFSSFQSWPSLLAIVGIGFLLQGYKGKDSDAILPGTIFLGLGIHFGLSVRMDVWPDHAGAFLLIIALGFLLRYQKTGTGMPNGLLFLLISALLLFKDKIPAIIPGSNAASVIGELWPIIFIAIGALLFITGGKK
ncbi:LiaI-LiaF-like domain-containing protein [Bacillus massilinigeriensis]|uniref:LiaI-LiaF-like domain-containing protein n=1 Tax=Bacillus mediterraneensis TaxID=1805474 RepID=UPI0008F84BC6|nr:DUF5668 domain-containing protein [Bacillus mediterraneensis]